MHPNMAPARGSTVVTDKGLSGADSDQL